jgi:CRISPR-associated protein Cas5d
MGGGRSEPFRVRARGELACFTRPEMKVERVSYELMTPSAARGVLEAILWKPQISWHVHAIEVLSPIRWASFRRNEVQSRASERTGEILVDDDRTQRNTVALRDVDYVIVGSFALSSRAGAGDNVAKYVEMFL